MIPFQAIIEASPVALLLIDSSLVIHYANKQAVELFGYTPDEFKKIKIEQLLPEKLRTKHEGLRNKFMKNPVSRPMGAGRDLFALTKSGTEFPAEIGLNIVNSNNALFILVSIIDITERKKSDQLILENSKFIEQQNKVLKESEQKLKDLNATKDKLFSVIGHDLRNPIGSIQSALELLTTDVDLKDTENLKDLLDSAFTTSKAAFELLDNLLEWARLQRNEVKFLPVNINLKSQVSDVIALHSEIADNKKIQVKESITDDIVVFSDKNMLQTILRNLISNALKFSYSGKEIHIGAFLSENMVNVFVRDQGIGIESQILEDIFNKANKSSAYGTANEKGTGLGLILCKGFVERCGGKIWAESTPGMGSTFHFTMPCKETGA